MFKRKKKDKYYDKYKKEEFIKYDIYEYNDSKSFDKFCKKHKLTTKQIEILKEVQEVFYYNLNSMKVEINKTPIRLGKQKLGDKLKNKFKEKFGKNKIPKFEYRYNFANEISFDFNFKKEVILTLSLFSPVGINTIPSKLKVAIDKLREEPIYQEEISGRYYISIKFEKIPIANELSKENEIIYVGSDGFSDPVKWEYNLYPNALVSGEVGSGKSIWANYILSQLIKIGEVTMIDFKGVDYSDQKNKFYKYYGYDESVQGVNYKAIIDEMRNYLDEMNEKKKLLSDYSVQKYTELPDEVKYKPKFLFIEEVPSLSVAIDTWVKNEIQEKKYPISQENNYTDKKNVKLPSMYSLPKYDFMKNLKEVILQGRALGYQIILVMQRADADFIPTVVRSQMNIKVVLGTPDSTALGMLDIKEKEIAILPKSGLGKGYIKTKGKVTYIEVPYYQKINEYVEI